MHSSLPEASSNSGKYPVHESSWLLSSKPKPFLKPIFSLFSSKSTVYFVILSIFVMQVVLVLLLDFLQQNSYMTMAAIDSIWLLALLSPVFYYFLFRPFVRQMHMREQAGDAFYRRQVTQLKNMLGASMDGYWVTDLQGHFLEVNDRYCQMSGYSADELLSMCISDVEVAEPPENIAVKNQQLNGIWSVMFETRHRRKDGTLLDIEVTANYTNVNLEKTGIRNPWLIQH